MLVLDLTRSFDGTATATDTIGLDVLRDAVTCAAPAGLDLHGLVLDGATGRILADHMSWLRRRLPSMEEIDVPEAVQATLGLLRGCFATAERSRAQDLARRDIEILHRASRFIDQNLQRPDLSVATICRAVGASRSALYRVFAPLSGIADYVKARRLEAIHVLFENSEDDRWNAEIAAEFGFTGQAHFSRSFKDRFGYSPRTARKGEDRLRDMRDMSERPDPELFREWIRTLD